MRPQLFPGSHPIVYVIGEESTGDCAHIKGKQVGMAARFRPRARGWFFRTKQPHHFTFLIALLLAIVGVASTRFQIEYVSAHAFWFVVAAYVVLALGTLIDGL